MWNFRRNALLLMLILPMTTILMFGSGVSQQAREIHVTTGLELHQELQGQAQSVVEARRYVSQTLQRYEIRAPGLDVESLQEHVAVLSDSEVLALQAQIMPFEEQMQTAGLENKVLIPLLAAVAVGLTIAMFLFAY